MQSAKAKLQKPKLLKAKLQRELRVQSCKGKAAKRAAKDKAAKGEAAKAKRRNGNRARGWSYPESCTMRAGSVACSLATIAVFTCDSIGHLLWGGLMRRARGGCGVDTCHPTSRRRICVCSQLGACHTHRPISWLRHLRKGDSRTWPNRQDHAHARRKSEDSLLL